LWSEDNFDEPRGQKKIKNQTSKIKMSGKEDSFNDTEGGRKMEEDRIIDPYRRGRG